MLSNEGHTEDPDNLAAWRRRIRAEGPARIDHRSEQARALKQEARLLAKLGRKKRIERLTSATRRLLD